MESDLLTISVNIGRAVARHCLSKNVGTGSRAHDLVGDCIMTFLSSSGVI